MIKIESKHINKIKNATKLQDLHESLQVALELEHSTIPPYLTATISLKPQTNREIWRIIHSVVVEEMLHLTIVANILNALNGKPVIDKPGFVPDYPGPLPLGIRENLIVGLEKYSKDYVKNVFMEIEEPENPLEFPVAASLRADSSQSYSTIGAFYEAIKEKINELGGNGNLPGDPSKQVTKYFSPDVLFPIKTKHDALKAIDIIVEQGEGTSKSPLDQDKDLAHYYLFAELYHGKKLVKDKKSYSYSGDPIPFTPENVYNIASNTKLAQLPPDSEAYQRAKEFAVSYTRLLKALHITFNGQPNFLENTIGLMYEIKLRGEKLAALPFPGRDGFTVGPTFEYVDVVF